MLKREVWSKTKVLQVDSLFDPNGESGLHSCACQTIGESKIVLLYKYFKMENTFGEVRSCGAAHWKKYREKRSILF